MLVLHARFRFGAYDAGLETDPRRPEWPPHPARLFCALVASDPAPDEWEALRWLERQSPPVIDAPPLLGSNSCELYVPTNDITTKSPNLPGRVSHSRRKPRALPAASNFAMVWPDALPEHGVLAGLNALARRVPYVGRSTTSAEVWFDDQRLASKDLECYEPTKEGGTLDLRVPYAGFAERLKELFERGARSWEASRIHGYRMAAIVDNPTDDPLISVGPFGRMLAFRFARPPHLHASKLVAITGQFRSSVMSVLDDPIPSAVSGHDSDHKTHVAFLGFPNVSHLGHLPDGPALNGSVNRHADGALLALAMAVPADDPELSRRLYRSLVLGENAKKKRLEALHFGRDGARVTLVPDQVGSGPLGSRIATWTRSSTTWATATPVVLDRYPKGREPAALVAEALVTAGYPAPEVVVANRIPILAGAPQLGHGSVARRGRVPMKPWVHAWVRFPQLIEGPVLAGSMRYRGLGLFLPLSTRSQNADQMDGDTGGAQPLSVAARVE
ncbi:MAG: type I-G CRISPR-associated protein Csb2 [Acidimicrobiales bacterium]